MLEQRSALEGILPRRGNGLHMEEAPDFWLLQVAGFGKGFDKAASAVLGKLPRDCLATVQHEGRTLFRTGPSQLWVVTRPNDNIGREFSTAELVTPLSHSRTRIAIAGGPAREVLAKGLPVDLHPAAFGPGRFAMTGLHHTPVLLHCTGDDTFHLYAMRTFALSVWEWLADAALEFA